MKYLGGCHCGEVRYEVEMEIANVMTCNCSICSKKGYLLTFAPEANLKVLKGASLLTEYLFRSKKIQHLFCKICGVASFGRGAMPDGTRMAMINARCLDDLDLKNIPVIEHDGKNH